MHAKIHGGIAYSFCILNCSQCSKMKFKLENRVRIRVYVCVLCAYKRPTHVSHFAILDATNEIFVL